MSRARTTDLAVASAGRGTRRSRQHLQSEPCAAVLAGVSTKPTRTTSARARRRCGSPASGSRVPRRRG